MMMKALTYPLLIILLFFTSCKQYPESGGISGNDQRDIDIAKINLMLSSVSEHAIKNNDSALIELNNAKDLADSIGFAEGVAKALFLKGILMYIRNEYQGALELYSQALQLAEVKQNHYCPVVVF
jgi:tetratricopeptide (TPR) repeat protein